MEATFKQWNVEADDDTEELSTGIGMNFMAAIRTVKGCRNCDSNSDSSDDASMICYPFESYYTAPLSGSAVGVRLLSRLS